MNPILQTRHPGRWLLFFALILVATVYTAGLNGSWLFDDYPNIVDNRGVQPSDLSTPSLVRALLSSPASEFKRPLASLSFAANYLISGLDPFGWKLTNLLIHLLNGTLVFGLTRALLRRHPVGAASAAIGRHQTHAIAAETAPTNGVIAALVATGWMLLPINLTGVLYVVQRMESMANLFVLLGLLGYVTGRNRMLAGAIKADSPDWRWFWLCAISITLPVAIGLLAKETAVMLPLYAGLIEWAMFRFRKVGGMPDRDEDRPNGHSKHQNGSPDRRLVTLFLLVLIVPMLIGLSLILPGLLKPETWATRDFTLGTRLLSEARIVVDYIGWTLLPTPGALSFYHDDFRISTGLLLPWTTLGSMVLLAALIALMFWLRPRRPLAALGIALFLGCQLLTGTILPLELIYEHRNYFASFGLLLAIVPLLAAPASGIPASVGATSVANGASLPSKSIAAEAAPTDALPFAWPRYALLAGLMLYWTTLTALTAYAWGDPLRLAEDLAERAPQSPRAQYELGRTYIIYSHYDPTSPFTRLAYAPLEASAKLPDSSILPEQALIFMNARMQLPQKDAWWDSLIAKLKARKSGVQDESSLSALTQCAREGRCNLPARRMQQAFGAALSHPAPTARLLSTYGDYAWNVLDDRALGSRMTADAVKTEPNEPAYRITLIRMLVATGHNAEANRQLQQLASFNIGDRLSTEIAKLKLSISPQ